MRDSSTPGPTRPLPIIRAAEGAECGLACIAMIARHLGHDIDLNTLRQRHPISMSGATLSGLLTISESLDLSARAVRAELPSVQQLRLPAILHWDLNHFVVLKSVKRQRYVIHDPNLGARTYSEAEFSRHYTGVAVEFTQTANFTAISDRSKVRFSDLWAGATGWRGAIVQILALSIMLQLLVFAAPFQIQLVIDQAIMSADRDLLTILALSFGAFAIIQCLIEFLRNYSAQIFSSALGMQMVGNIFHHLLRLKANYFAKRHVGDILSRMSSSAAIQSFITRGVVTTALDGVMAFAALIILFVYSPGLSAVVIGCFLLNAAISLAAIPVIRSKTEEQIANQAREQSHLMETIRAAVTIKMMGREAEREAEWRNRYASVVNAGLSIGTFSMSVAALQSIIAALGTVLVIYLGARSILDASGLSVGMLFAFMSFRQTFSDRSSALLAQAMQFRFMELHLERVSDIVTSKREPEILAAPASSVIGDIELRGVSFRYGATDPLVLNEVDLKIEAGSFVAITGPSGGGKTTLMKLLLGLETPESGALLHEGQPATEASIRRWRNSVGVVAQDDRLLTGTIADNIAFFDPDLNMERVRSAAVTAQLHDQVMQMPMQYLSQIGDMGSALSGGQRQRVLLARALYRQPSVLILDEGTANLDEATEEIIANVVASMNVTRIVVAHRPALLTRADRVIRVACTKLSEHTPGPAPRRPELAAGV